jgi:hypothetical protein
MTTLLDLASISVAADETLAQVQGWFLQQGQAQGASTGALLGS